MCAIQGLGSPSPVHPDAASMWAVSSEPSPVALLHACRVITLMHAGLSSTAMQRASHSAWEPLTGLQRGTIFHCFRVIRGQK